MSLKAVIPIDLPYGKQRCEGLLHPVEACAMNVITWPAPSTPSTY